jgi:hypothetical protein
MRAKKITILILALLTLSACGKQVDGNLGKKLNSKSEVKIFYHDLNTKASYIKIRIFNNEEGKKDLLDQCLDAKPLAYLLKKKYIKTNLSFNQLIVEKLITVTPSKIYQGCMYNLFYQKESSINSLITILTPTLVEDD